MRSSICHQIARPACCGLICATACRGLTVVTVCIGLTVCGITGCTQPPAPPLGIVRGTVTLDGIPLPNATVRFTPAGPGRTSQGITDEAGRFRLHYLRDIPGADIDHHVVRITTAGEQADGRERLPPRYHCRSLLEARVRAGDNVVDFALTSQ